MATKKKMLQAAAGNATGGGGLNVEDVFSTNLYTGTNAALTVNTGLDQNTEGGMLWVKSRSTSSTNHGIWDTERTNGYYLPVNSTDNGGNIAAASGTTPFLRDGSFRWNSGHGWFNQSGEYVAWAFRKAPKFFDVVTYTGDGTNNRQIAHNLGSVPGCIIIKMTSGQKDWKVYHRGLDPSNPEDYKIHLNEAAARSGGSTLFDAPTDTHFILDSNDDVNGNGDTYVAYLFAHNDADGGFGPDGDADIIKCGSFTTDGSGNFSVDLGFEPEFFLTKRTDVVQNWYIWDTMRGWTVSGLANGLVPNASSAELNYFGGTDYFHPTASGIEGSGNFFGTNANVIYIAIRRGTKVPESATEVFAVDLSDTNSDNDRPCFISGFPVDFAVYANPVSDGFRFTGTRLAGTGYLQPNTTAAEGNSANWTFDWMNGWRNNFNTAGLPSWMWKRAPGFFDVVAYGGTGNTTQTKNHNLGVVPEMIWAKRRSGIGQWGVYHKDIGFLNTLVLNDTSALQSASAYWKATPTETEFYVGPGLGASGEDYIAYLFASLDGISKVGSYTGNGSSQNIDCGFSSGARFVLIKRTDNSGSWWVFDTERGIVSGNDAALALDSTSAEISVDWIDPYSAGFKVATSFSEINASGGSYIFYAIA